MNVIWLDIHYQDNFKPFTWNRKRFPHPEQMISDLKAQGFRTICIVDAHPKAEKGYLPYDSGMAGDCFVKRPDGSVYEGPVWPSKAEINPGPSVFPDFSRPDVRQWWGGLYKMFVDEGVAGIWNDMNEPCVFSPPTWTMPLDLVFDNEGQPTSAREIHNVYGQLMSQSTFEGLGRLRPQERPFVLTRATFAGGQRYAAVWPGDNSSEWSSLRQSISTLLGLGLSGFPFVGCDIGGFVGSDSPELYTRWLELGVFYPFMRSHSDLGSPDKEPWSFGSDYEAINKRMIELRYEMLPYIYNVMHQASETGVPAMRPLFMEFPAEEDSAAIDDEFLFGHDLLVAPVLYQGQTGREVYLPKSDWYDYWTGQLYVGGQSIHVPVTINSLPLFVRAGGFIFEQPVVQNTTEMAGNPVRILIAPATNSESTLYEDDGETIAYRSGKYVTRKLSQTSSPTALTVVISPPEGPCRPAARDLFLETWMVEPPKSVSLVDNAGVTNVLARAEAGSLTNSVPGWSYTAPRLIIKTPDHFEPEQFIIQR